MGVMERIPLDGPLPDAHPWVRRFLARPQKAFDQLISGAAIIDPYYSLEPEDVLCILAGDAPPEHVFWDKLNEQSLRWLVERRGWSAEKRAAYGLNAYVGGVVGVISIVGRLNLTGVVDDFKKNYWTWMRWAADLRLGSSHDPYWAVAATVALQQTEQDGGRFVRRWHELIENAGQADDWSDARNGLAALRHVPSREQPPKEWLLGFARFAATLPDSKEAKAAFERIWREETIFFPRGPEAWRKLVAPYFDLHILKDAPALNWWQEQVKWSKESVKKERRTPERSPMPSEAQAVMRKLRSDDWRQGVAEGKALMQRHVAFAEKTGDANYLARACSELGKEAIQVDPQWAHDLARTNLLWAPNDAHGWTLWLRALTRLGDAKSAEMVAWESLRRFPDDVVARNALGNLLLQMGQERLEEAETCFVEALRIDPGDGVAPIGLASVANVQRGIPKPTGAETPPPDRADAFAREVTALRSEALCQRADATLTLLGDNQALRDRSEKDLQEVLRNEPSHPLALMLQARDNPDRRAKLGEAVSSWGLNLYAAQDADDVEAFRRLTKTAPERRPVVLLARRLSPARDHREDGALAGFVNEDLRDGADAALRVVQARLRRMAGWEKGRGVSTPHLTATLNRHEPECRDVLWDVAKLTAVRGALPFAD